MSRDHGGPGDNVSYILGAGDLREEPIGGGDVGSGEIGGDGSVNGVDIAAVAKPDGERVEEAGELMAWDAGAGVEREGEGDVVGQEAVEEQEAEEKRAGGGEGGNAKEGVDGGVGGEVARGQENGVCAGEAGRLGGGGGGHDGEPRGGPGVKEPMAHGRYQRHTHTTGGRGGPPRKEVGRSVGFSPGIGPEELSFIELVG
jgi:hypothetical protein